MNPDGTRGELVRTNRKSGTGGSCMADLFNLRFGADGEWPRTYAFGSCRIPYEPSNGVWVAALAPGWGDEYPWWFADTFMEITGVPDGDYVFELEVNIERSIVEASSSNNVATARIRLEGDSVTEL
jgi:hypothetical protein